MTEVLESKINHRSMGEYIATNSETSTTNSDCDLSQRTARSQSLGQGLAGYGDSHFSLFLRRVFMRALGYGEDALSRPMRQESPESSFWLTRRDCHLDGSNPMRFGTWNCSSLQKLAKAKPTWKQTKSASGTPSSLSGLIGRSTCRHWCTGPVLRRTMGSNLPCHR